MYYLNLLIKYFTISVVFIAFKVNSQDFDFYLVLSESNPSQLVAYFDARERPEESLYSEIEFFVVFGTANGKQIQKDFQFSDEELLGGHLYSKSIAHGLPNVQTLLRGEANCKIRGAGGKADGPVVVKDSSTAASIGSAPTNEDTNSWNLPNGYYTIKQKQSNRFMDAHEYEGRDFGLVTRNTQENDTQVWMLRKSNGNEYTIQQKSSRRYMDAHEYKANDYRVVTRDRQDNDTQLWIIQQIASNQFRIKQKSSDRYLDAYTNSAEDFQLVTRTYQNNDSQIWIIEKQATSPNYDFLQ